VRYVPAEYLVGTLPGQCDSHLTRCQPGQRVETERRQIGERLVQMPQELLERYGLVRERELELVVLGSESGRDEPRIRQLVALNVFDEAHRERFDRPGCIPGHQPGDDR
jgi:hypothetical protein